MTLETEYGLLDFILLKAIKEEDAKLMEGVILTMLSYGTSLQILDYASKLDPFERQFNFIRFYGEVVISLALNTSTP